ncbi:COG4315 family predicted lipoprotein [Virgifigura deserti]|uniref:COG4315 family predicted lipoprotein n=1 Tax=Virgifigura deserti TaxID=2268457 RepID=UPI003CCC3444
MKQVVTKAQERDVARPLMLGLLAAGSALALLAHAALAQAADQAELEVAEAQEYGPYIADTDGRALYMFEADSEGNSTCYDACAEAWPPLLTAGEPAAGQRAQEGLLGTTERKDGAMQVTYNGWPLYYFVKDKGPGETTGQDVKGFGAEWYLVSPEGEPIHEGGHEESSQQ